MQSYQNLNLPQKSNIDNIVSIIARPESINKMRVSSMPDISDALLIVNIRSMIDYHRMKESESRAFGDSKEANRHRDAIATLSNSLVKINERVHDINK
jgi:hypothetical protein